MVDVRLVDVVLVSVWLQLSVMSKSVSRDKGSDEEKDTDHCVRHWRDDR
jgi:hypothetical protein